MARMTITLEPNEKAVLIKYAENELKDPRWLAGWLIHQQLERLGLLQPAPTIPQKGTTRERQLAYRLGAILDGDPETIREACIRLRAIMARDFPESAIDDRPMDEGAEDYVIRAVTEALFGE